MYPNSATVYLNNGDEKTFTVGSDGVTRVSVAGSVPHSLQVEYVAGHIEVFYNVPFIVMYHSK